MLRTRPRSLSLGEQNFNHTGTSGATLMEYRQAQAAIMTGRRNHTAPPPLGTQATTSRRSICGVFSAVRSGPVHPANPAPATDTPAANGARNCGHRISHDRARRRAASISRRHASCPRFPLATPKLAVTFTTMPSDNVNPVCLQRAANSFRQRHRIADIAA